jgi:D-alanyl-D-alanine carboxypeptidase (penicillin-binding protein 5/6)
MKALARILVGALLLAPVGHAHAEQAGKPAREPEVRLEAGILVDTTSGKVLWARDQRSARMPASLTKILTALVVLERVNIDDVVEIKPEYLAIEGARLGAQPGWMMTVRDLLWGLLLQSANDAALALAYKASPDGTVPGFVRVMNERAENLGAKRTHFKNPHGLPEEGHTSTALDLATITIAAMQNPVFVEMVGTRSHDITRSDGTIYTFNNVNKLLSQYEGAVGIKTGFTSEGGRNLASAVSREGSTLVSIVLGSPSHFNETMDIYDWAFANLEALRAQPSKESRSVRPPGKGPADLRGLEVVEFDAESPASSDSGVAPLAAPAGALMLALVAWIWIRRRRSGLQEDNPPADQLPEPSS